MTSTSDVAALRRCCRHEPDGTLLLNKIDGGYHYEIGEVRQGMAWGLLEIYDQDLIGEEVKWSNDPIYTHIFRPGDPGHDKVFAFKVSVDLGQPAYELIAEYLA